LIEEIKKWICTCDGCGKKVSGSGPIPILPDNWHKCGGFSDGYAGYLTITSGNYKQIGAEKHYCHDCFLVKDIIE
jgi:hypothetical protein